MKSKVNSPASAAREAANSPAFHFLAGVVVRFQPGKEIVNDHTSKTGLKRVLQRQFFERHDNYGWLKETIRYENVCRFIYPQSIPLVIGKVLAM